MDGDIGLGLLVGLGILSGSVFGWVAFFQLIELRKHVNRLQSEFDKLISPHPTSPPKDVTAPLKRPTTQPSAAATSTPAPASTPPSTLVSAKTAALKSTPPKIATTQPSLWIQHIKTNWMIWLGGTSVGLSGIFLVKYSIGAGLLGPVARVSLAILTGLTFHALAFWLKQRNNGEAEDVFAALAGGASIMVYAALLAAVHLYGLWSPGVVFTLLALTSMLTMALALFHGPVLAAIGILGAYAVPILVNTGSNNVAGALVYTTIISFSALWLMRYVYRSWLWVGTLTGALVWWFIALSSPIGIGAQLLYLAFLTYGLLAISHKNWLLNQAASVTETQGLLTLFRDKNHVTERRLFAAIMALLAAQLLTLAFNETNHFSLLSGLLMPAILLWYCRHHPLYALLGWISFAALATGLLAGELTQGLFHSAHDNNQPLIAMLATTTLLYTSISVWILRERGANGFWASLACLSPIICLAIAYIRITALTTTWEWPVAALALGASYLHILHRQRRHAPSPAVIAALTIAAHLAYSLAVIMLFREATLTLALAVQLVTLVWLERSYSLPILEWVIKGLVGLVITRLTLNPWLLTYPTDLHWSLWVCGGSFVATAVAAWLARDRQRLQPWLQGAALHLLALTLLFEVRYQLYDGNIFTHTYTFLEGAINTSIWGLIGNVYLFRARSSEHLGRFYMLCGSLLLTLSVANYGWILLLLKNPLWSSDHISATPIFNLLLMAYGAPVLLAILAYGLSAERFRKFIGVIAAVMLWYFISIEIRHLWHGTLNTYSATSNGEHYSYSMAWLLLAILGSVIGIRFEKQLLYKGAMAFLMCVVAKIFLFDMSGLTGLWRVGSFMALGISLLGLSWLHQHIRRRYAQASQAIR